MPARIVFVGSPEFALPSLQALSQAYPLIGAVTQPDRPAGRGRALTPPPVKLLAHSLGLPVIQPRRLRDPDAVDQLRAWAPDLIVVAAFGQILRPEVLDLPPMGCINVHASLLPRWRGAAPVQAAILNGDTHTGVTIMKMDPGVDTGPLLSQRATPIEAGETTGSLSDRLSHLGADLLIEVLPVYLAGDLPTNPQDESLSTYAPMLKKEDAALDFSFEAEVLARQVHAFNPWPGAHTTVQGEILKVHRAHAVSAVSPGPGVQTVQDGLPAIGTCLDLLVLDEVQPAGKRPMPGKDFLRGSRSWGK